MRCCSMGAQLRCAQGAKRRIFVQPLYKTHRITFGQRFTANRYLSCYFDSLLSKNNQDHSAKRHPRTHELRIVHGSIIALSPFKRKYAGYRPTSSFTPRAGSPSLGAPSGGFAPPRAYPSAKDVRRKFEPPCNGVFFFFKKGKTAE